MIPKTAAELLEDANCDFVGIDDKGRVSGGYDQNYDNACQFDSDFDPAWHGERLPAAERLRLAAVMIQRWNAYSNAALDERLKEKGR